MAETLIEKVWNQHAARQLPNGLTQLYVGLHLVHEVTGPRAFDMLTARGWPVGAPHRAFATMDHIVPTNRQAAIGACRSSVVAQWRLGGLR